ncbi:MAG: DUF493 domain-containing protein [Cytophagaceae bacterium]
MAKIDFTGLKEKLDNLAWPAIYMFKFIVPADKERDLVEIFDNRLVEKRFSKNKKYVSITSCYMLSSGDDVIRVYERASTIDGVVSL